MAVVVSDATPLHYLILISRDGILERLYGRVIVPPAVLDELGHGAAPFEVSNWVKAPPAWLTVKAPSAIPRDFETLDLGERQALALAREIQADLVLLDDKVARRFAEKISLRAKGTLGILAQAARLGLLDFRATVGDLQRTSMHLDPKLAQRMVEEFEKGARK
jgi:predicted nucleic acid-binding protein